MKLSFGAIASLAFFFAPSARAQNGTYDPKTCWAHPDPHFSTWNGDYYDYQGGCEVVLVQNSVIDLHIRTEVRGFYSAVVNAALLINGTILEVNETDYMVDGVVQTGPAPTHIGGRPFTTSFGTTDLFEVKLEPDAGNFYVRIARYSFGSLSVSVLAHKTGFEDSEGMCGWWNTSGLIKRDGTVASDGTEMGENWQVDLLTEPDLFEDDDNFLPGECEPPCEDYWYPNFDGGPDTAMPPNGKAVFLDGNETGAPTNTENPFFTEAPNSCFPNGQGGRNGEHLRRRAQPFDISQCDCDDPSYTPAAKANCYYDAQTTQSCFFDVYYNGQIPELSTFYVPAAILAPNPCAHLTCDDGSEPVLDCDTTLNVCGEPEDPNASSTDPPNGNGPKGKKKAKGESKKGSKGKKSKKKHTEAPTDPTPPPVIVPGCSCAYPLP